MRHRAGDRSGEVTRSVADLEETEEVFYEGE